MVFTGPLRVLAFVLVRCPLTGLAVTHATVATDFNESFDIQSNFTAKVAFYCDVLVDIVTQLCNVFFGQILDADIRIDTGTCQNLICCAAADSVDISQTDLDPLILRKVYTCYSCHSSCTSMLKNPELSPDAAYASDFRRLPLLCLYA